MKRVLFLISFLLIFSTVAFADLNAGESIPDGSVTQAKLSPQVNLKLDREVGDMYKSSYDSNYDNAVDNAENSYLLWNLHFYDFAQSPNQILDIKQHFSGDSEETLINMLPDFNYYDCIFIDTDVYSSGSSSYVKYHPGDIIQKLRDEMDFITHDKWYKVTNFFSQGTNEVIALDEIHQGIFMSGATQEATIGKFISLQSLKDVSAATPASGQILKWDGTNWALATDDSGSGGSSTLVDLTDTTITSPQNFNVLFYNGSSWINKQLSSTDIDYSTKLTNNEIDLSTINASELNYSTKLTSNEVDFSGILSTDIDYSTKLTSNEVDFSTIDLSLPDLSDTTITSPTDGNFLIYNSGTWLNYAVGLDELNDCDINSPSQGQVLLYNGTSWINHQLKSTAIDYSTKLTSNEVDFSTIDLALNDLNDVTAVAADKNIIIGNGTDWESRQLQSTDIDYTTKLTYNEVDFTNDNTLAGTASFIYPYGDDIAHLMYDPVNSTVYLPRDTYSTQIYKGTPADIGTSWDWEYMDSDNRILGRGYFGDIDTVNEVLYYGGGGDFNSNDFYTLNVFYKYDINSQTVTTLADIPLHVKYACSTWYNGKLFVFGGQTSTDRTLSYNTTNKIQVYDSSNNTWSYDYTEEVIAGGQYIARVGNIAYVFGGKDARNDGEIYFSDVWAYNLDDLSQRTQKASIPETMAYGKCRYDSSTGKIVLVGGEDGSNTNIINSVYVYDVTEDTWVTGSPYPRPLRLQAMYLYNGFIYVYQFYLDEFVPSYKYDIVNDTWNSILSGAYLVIDYSSYGYSNPPNVLATLNNESGSGYYPWGVFPIVNPIVLSVTSTTAIISLGYNLNNKSVPANSGKISYFIKP